METKGSKIVKNYYEKLKQEFEQKPLQLNREELINLIREIVRDEIQKIPSPTLTEPEFLSIKEASNYLNLAVTTLYEKTSLKLIPFHKRDKKLYFKKQELAEWLLEKNHEATILKLPVPKKNRKAA